MNLREFIQSEIKSQLYLSEGVDWKAFYTMAKDTSGYNPSFEKKYGKLLDRPHVKDALDKTKDFNSFMKFIKKFESVDESILSEKKPSKIVWDTKKISAAKRINVRKWYMKTYPTDELGREIDKRNTLWDIYSYLSQGVDAYDAIGVADSVVRERVFEKLSKVLGVDYDTIYDMWESVNEGIWPKSKLADRFEFILSNELKKNFKGFFHVDGYDLYHNDKKVMTINPDTDSANSIVKKLKSKIKESVNEKYTGNPGDKLTHKYDKNTEIELIEPTNRGWKVYQTTKGKRKIAYFDKQDIVGDKALFESEQLDEKLITFSNRAPYGQVVFMAGGAGSGKGFAIDNFIDAAGFKVRDVDEMKKAVANLNKLGSFSVDRWYKKYGKKLSTKPPKNNPGGMSPKEHIEEFFLGKGLSIADIANPKHKSGGLKNPINVASLHYIVDAMGLKDKWVINMLKGKENKETLPNLLFDITAKKVSSITDVIEPLIDAGYDPKNIHLIWVLKNFSAAVEANKDRDRVVPDDILLQTHEGAAKTMWEVLTQIKPKGLDGRIDVILNNNEFTAKFVDKNGNEIEVQPNQRNKFKEARPVVKGFKSLPIKKQGGGIYSEKVWKNILKNWILSNTPKTISLSQDVMKVDKKK